MQLYTNSIQDRFGNAQAGATITVRTVAGVIAVIYSDNGVTLSANPLTADTSGEFAFYAANGRYTFTVTATKMQAETVNAFEMYDAVELQASVTANAASAAASQVSALASQSSALASQSAALASKLAADDDRIAAETAAAQALTRSVAAALSKLDATNAAASAQASATAAQTSGSAIALTGNLAASGGAALVGGANQVVQSIADLRGLNKASASKNAFVTGYYAAGDGGGGAYYYDSSDTTSLDNGGTVITAMDGGRWKLTTQSAVSVKQFGARGDGVADDAPAIQAAVNAVFNVYLPSTVPSYYKTLSTITLRSCSFMHGDEEQGTIVGAWGVDAITVPAGAHNVSVERMEIHGHTVAGGPDAKLYSGIACLGTGSTSATGVFLMRFDRLYFRGCINGIDGRYLWNSVINDTKTINCTNGVRLFGQSVNNFITSCYLQANGGNASILTVKDGAARGEGLMVTGCLLASGNWGILSDGFLLMTVVGCTIDLIQNKGIEITNGPALIVNGNWIYANQVGISLAPLGGAVAIGAAFANNYITTPATNGIGIYVGANNVGVSVTGGAIQSVVNSRSVLSFGDAVSVTGVYCANSGANRSIYFAGADSCASLNTGQCLVDWGIAVPSQKGQTVATAAFTGTTGSASFATGCTVIRNGVGDYSITFNYPLISAAYVPMVNIDRGTFGAMGYAVTTQTTTGFRFTVTNQNAVAQDVTTVWIAVFN